MMISKSIFSGKLAVNKNIVDLKNAELARVFSGPSTVCRHDHKLHVAPPASIVTFGNRMVN